MQCVVEEDPQCCYVQGVNNSISVLIFMCNGVEHFASQRILGQV